VIFADAAGEGPETVFLRGIEGDEGMQFHDAQREAGGGHGLARSLFQARTSASCWPFAVTEFNEFGERLSARARANLAAAEQFMMRALPELLAARGWTK